VPIPREEKTSRRDQNLLRRFDFKDLGFGREDGSGGANGVNCWLWRYRRSETCGLIFVTWEKQVDRCA
jgi:hypothetical protein